MSRKVIYYRPYLKEISRKLRRRCTKAEKILWQQLRRKQLKGYQFYRQKPIDKYVVDFFCFELMLAIEIDGITHNDKSEYDDRRDDDIMKQGITMLHFYDTDIHENLLGVMELLTEWIENFENSQK